MVGVLSSNVQTAVENMMAVTIHIIISKLQENISNEKT